MKKTVRILLNLLIVVTLISCDKTELTKSELTKSEYENVSNVRHNTFKMFNDISRVVFDVSEQRSSYILPTSAPIPKSSDTLMNIIDTIDISDFIIYGEYNNMYTKYALITDSDVDRIFELYSNDYNLNNSEYHYYNAKRFNIRLNIQYDSITKELSEIIIDTRCIVENNNIYYNEGDVISVYKLWGNNRIIDLNPQNHEIIVDDNPTQLSDFFTVSDQLGINDVNYIYSLSKDVTGVYINDDLLNFDRYYARLLGRIVQEMLYEFVDDRVAQEMLYEFVE